MFLDLLVLLFSSAAWIAILWTAFVPSFSKWSNLGIVGLHAAPPLILWAIWLTLRRRVRAKEAGAVQLRERQAQAERESSREAARKQHEEIMRQRRFGCDCRVVALAGVGMHPGLPLMNVDAENVHLHARPLAEVHFPTGTPALDRLSPAIHDALSTIYQSCEAATAFPIYIRPPSDVAGEQALDAIRSACADAAEGSIHHDERCTNSPPILFLPSSDNAANSAIALFDSTPDLPGAIVLAFDSAIARSPAPDPGDDIGPAAQERVRQAGKPSEGVFALLLTNPELDSMLKSIDEVEENPSPHDSMMPYWQKPLQPDGPLAALSRTTRERRAQLLQLPVLARIRRSASRPRGHDTGAPQAGVLAMARIIQESLEDAQINAGIIDVRFPREGIDSREAGAGGSDSMKTQSSPEKAACLRLVHNAGGVDFAGKRLAALGAAMYHFGIDLNPADIDTSINMATRIGDLGHATGIGQLALGIAHAADTGASALCAEFCDGGGFSVGFVTPAAAT